MAETDTERKIEKSQSERWRQEHKKRCVQGKREKESEREPLRVRIRDRDSQREG